MLPRKFLRFDCPALDVHRIKKSTRPEQSEVNPGETGGGSMDSKMKTLALSVIFGAAQKKVIAKESSHIPSSAVSKKCHIMQSCFYVVLGVAIG